MASLGDGGGLPNNDMLYTGDNSTSPISMDYYRQKALEFQQVLIGLDQAYAAANVAFDAAVSDEVSAWLLDWMDQYESRKTTLKITAEAINAGAAIVNSAGGRLPQLSIPGSLGMAPLVIPAASLTAIAVAAALAYWAVDATRALADYLKRAQAIAAQDTPEKAAAVALAGAQADNAVASMNGSIFGIAGNAIKWVAIAALGWFAFQAYSNSKKARR
ncbi:MAG: hypothetical protein ACOYBQ_10255 [Fluviibacter sp.]